MNPTNFANADFTLIREDLKAYLRQTEEFKDFDFEGSAASMLLNMLAYTSNYMALHANMALTEVFLDSCQRRTSAVSRAKELGYFPRQISAARAQAEVTVSWVPPTSTVSSMTVLEGSVFSARANDGTGYDFVTLADSQLAAQGNDTYVGTLDIYEGKILKRTFTYPSTLEIHRFVIPDKDIETDYFKVKVKEPGDADYTPYYRELNVVEITNETKTFFLQEGVNEAIEFYFGDGIIGHKPAIGSEIVVEYLVTKGSQANGVTSFTLDASPVATLAAGGFLVVPVSAARSTTVEKSAYGAAKQSIESIKFTAPKSYAAQNRAVTEGDYQALLLREFGFIEAITVWGGETNDPPLYGKVLVSVKPRDGTRLSPAVKQQMKEQVLDKFSIVGIVPDIVDPDYTFVDVFTTVQYEKERTFEPESVINSNIATAIADYFGDVVTKFNGLFRFSNLVANIDDSNASILGNSTTYRMIKTIIPTPSALKKYTVKFFNPIKPGSLVSEAVPIIDSGAMLTLVGRDNGRIDALLNGNMAQAGVGTVDYANGIINFDYRFDIAPNTNVNLSVICANQDMVAKQNNLITLRNTSINLQRWYKNQISGSI